MNEHIPTSPEFGSRSEDLAEFNEIIERINKHNRQISVGELITRAMSDHEEMTINDGLTHENTMLIVDNDSNEITQSIEEDAARLNLGQNYATFFETIGLTVSSLHVFNSAIVYKNEDCRENSNEISSSIEGMSFDGKVHLQLTDGYKFGDFLHAVNTKMIDEVFQMNVKGVVNDLITSLTDDIIFKHPYEQSSLVQTLAYSKYIINGLECIDLSNASETEILQNIYEHWQCHDIKEYVMADKIGLFQEPNEESVGPSQWHRNLNEEYLLEYRWNTVIKVINVARANPDAKSLYLQLVELSRAALDYAKADWAKIKKEGGVGGVKYGKKFDQIFNEIGVELCTITDEDNV